MIAIESTLVSDDLLEKKFVCDLNACKGACCVEGASGAPLEESELKILDSIVEDVKPFMTKKGIKAIDKHGTYVKDSDGDWTTTLVHGEEGECAFVFFDEHKIAKCAIEKAYHDGKVNWKKPISCHLYPVRTKEYKNYTAVNYHKWDICKPACECGKKLEVPVYKFLKTPLIRKFGKKWYEQLELTAKKKFENSKI